MPDSHCVAIMSDHADGKPSLMVTFHRDPGGTPPLEVIALIIALFQEVLKTPGLHARYVLCEQCRASVQASDPIELPEVQSHVVSMGKAPGEVVQ